MQDPILIIDNHLELEVIQGQHPQLNNAPLILLSSMFSPQQLKSFESRGYHWFDKIKVTDHDARRMTGELNHLLWHWFLDEQGKDLSEIDGCSLGGAFASSLEITLNTVIRYQAGLGKLLKPNHMVYHSSRCEDIFLDTIGHLQRHIGFERVVIETLEEQDSEVYGSRAQKFDPDGRKRDLAPIFRSGGWKEKAASAWLNHLQPSGNGKKRVLLMPAGKLEIYFEHVRKQGYPDGFRWILPLAGPRDLLRRDPKDPLFYHFSAIGPDRSGETAQVIRRLKENICKRVEGFDPQLLILVMERYAFIHFPGALKYYCSALRMFNTMKPDLAIFSADAYENFILASQAAKRAGIPTAIIPHGLSSGSGFSQYLIGRNQVFDYALAIGKVDVENYLHFSVPHDNIHTTSFPYFERFLPLLKNESTEYLRVLILSPDKFDISLQEKVGGESTFYVEVCKLMDELGIEITAIKARSSLHFRNFGLKDYKMEINDKVIPLLSGYSSFPDAAKEVDLIIGPASTALIEAGLMGKDYYVYQHTAFHENNPNIFKALFEFVNASFDMGQLRDNILKRQPYKQGYSVKDLLDLEGVETNEDLYKKFESSIEAVLDNIETSKNITTTREKR